MSNSEIIATYFKAIQTGDLAKLGALVAADVIWHQPGDNQFSGTHTGAEAVFAMIGSMMEASAGTFKIDLVKDIMVNGGRGCCDHRFFWPAQWHRDGAWRC